MKNSTRLWLLSSAVLLSTQTMAQSGLRVNPLPAPPKHRGTYDLATQTWRRGHDTGSTKVLYNNNANTGFFGSMPHPMDWTDEGRIPGGDDPNLPTAKGGIYVVHALEIAYCTSQGSAGQGGALTIYEAYSACTEPSPLTPAGHFAFHGPGSSAAGTTACWIVTFDLSGTTIDIKLPAEADHIFDNDCDLDSFGWTFTLTDVSGGPAGPLLNGDPLNFAEGDGTYYQNPSSTGTGLCTMDEFWLFDVSGVNPAGCYWFGGYPANPYSSFWLRVLGEKQIPPDGCMKHCQANPNSTGSPASISSFCDFINWNLQFSAAPVPNQPGIFFHAQNPVRLPFGNGFLCTAVDIVRTGVVVGSGNMASRVIDFSSYPATVRHVQYWFRDPAGGGTFFNTSNALRVETP